MLWENYSAVAAIAAPSPLSPKPDFVFAYAGGFSPMLEFFVFAGMCGFAYA